LGVWRTARNNNQFGLHRGSLWLNGGLDIETERASPHVSPPTTF
jgi:hypothetical protein